MVAGLVLGKMLRISGNASYLITAGTAICGGSAIAAIGPILHADDERDGCFSGDGFILNSIALLTFPPIGNALHLTQSQFGLWAALAIHDTSSVVGARQIWQRSAGDWHNGETGARAVDCAAGAGDRGGEAQQGQGAVAVVHFVFLPGGGAEHLCSRQWRHFDGWVFSAGRLGLTATLFLIGSGISVATMKSVGWRPMLQGVVLWMLVATTTLYLIRTRIISYLILRVGRVWRNVADLQPGHYTRLK